MLNLAAEGQLTPLHFVRWSRATEEKFSKIHSKCCNFHHDFDTFEVIYKRQLIAVAKIFFLEREKGGPDYRTHSLCGNA